MTYLVELTDRAERDMAGLFVEKNAIDSAAAARWFNGLEQAVYSLQTYPSRCPMAPESKKARRPLRHLLYGRTPRIPRGLRGRRAKATRPRPHHPSRGEGAGGPEGVKEAGQLGLVRPGGALRHCHRCAEVHILDRVQQRDAFVHGTLERLAAGDQTHSAGAFVDHRRGHRVGHVVLA
jgi:toxin ParE1/3/4